MNKRFLRGWLNGLIHFRTRVCGMNIGDLSWAEAKTILTLSIVDNCRIGMDVLKAPCCEIKQDEEHIGGCEWIFNHPFTFPLHFTCTTNWADAVKSPGILCRDL